MLRHCWNHELRAPLLTAAIVSVLGTILIGVRALLTRHGLQLFLVWNLFLAWLPLLLALRLEASERQGGINRWQFWMTALLWMLFFPNAPYIFTDLTHLHFPVRPRWWTDLIVILLFAVTGMVLAFLSLQRMQRMVARHRGTLAGWLFVAGVAFASAFGVCLGRFERWNSWDVVTSPIAFAGDSVNWIHRSSVKFTVLFGFFLCLVHALLYSLTSLNRPAPALREGTYERS